MATASSHSVTHRRLSDPADATSAYDVSQACGWALGYIEALISGQHGARHEFETKAIGELALLYHLSTQHGGPTAGHISAQFSHLIDRIFRWIEQHANQKSEDIYGLCTALDFLGLGHTDCGKRCKLEIERKIPSFFKSPRSAEHAFYLGTIGTQVPSSYWRRPTKMLLERMLKDGASLKELYEYSHIVFYVTEFGLSSANEVLLPYLTSVNDLFYRFSHASRNWDAQIEICAACLCLGRPHGPLQIFQSTQGWILSDGVQAPESFDTRTLYSLFHTTCVMLLYHMISETAVSRA